MKSEDIRIGAKAYTVGTTRNFDKTIWSGEIAVITAEKVELKCDKTSIERKHSAIYATIQEAINEVASYLRVQAAGLCDFCLAIEAQHCDSCPLQLNSNGPYASK